MKKKNRAREAGIPLFGEPGRYNAITDVPGVEVGFSTVLYGEPEDFEQEGSPFARTGVTAILPRGHKRSAVFAGRHDLNGNGELTGTHWVDDSGFLHGPILLTNTNSVGIVRDTASKWMVENAFYHPLYFDGRPVPGSGYFYPVVGETWDGILNDINGFHVTTANALEALDAAKTGPLEEGNVGGGTGMCCHEFKGGTGTASRKVATPEGEFTLGVLVQANHGTRELFQINGVRMGDKITDCDPIYNSLLPEPGTGSIIAIVATDAPMLPHQLAKLCKRIPIGIGLLGSGYENGSGDIFLAFSTANEEAFSYGIADIHLLSDDLMNPFYKATAEVVEEAILNALFAARTMVGRENNTIYELPQEQVINILRQHCKI